MHLMMPAPLGVLRKLVRRLRLEERAFAMIEFALILPIFVGFGLVGLEYTNLVLAAQKTERIASTVADQVASNQVPPNERQIRDMFLAVDNIAKPFSIATNGTVKITAVIGVYDRTTDKVQNKIAWQRCMHEDKFDSQIGEQWTDTTNIADGPEANLPDNLKLGQNQMVIVAEVFQIYRPIISQMIVESHLPENSLFTETSVFRTRGAAIMNVTPVTGIDQSKCKA